MAGRINELGLYELENIRFEPNIREFSRAAQYFQKHGVYTKAHPIYDRKEYLEFWREERKRRIEGYSIGGVRITGEHYGFLNYAPILRTVEVGDVINIPLLGGSRRRGKKKLDFPDFWDGHYHWFHAKEFAKAIGKHIIGLKSRRKGFSYVGGWQAFNTYDLYPDLTTIIGAFDNKYLIKAKGTMSMVRHYSDFINENTAWRKRRLINTKDHIKSGYKFRGRDEEFGFKSEILALSFMNNPDAAVGKDIYELYLEELGVFPNLDEALDVTLPALEDGGVMTGQLIGWGTGGTDEANWEAFERAFYEPNRFNCMAFDNQWDIGTKGETSGYFFPYNLNFIYDETTIDKCGNSNIAASDVLIDQKMEEQRKILDSVRFSKYQAQRARTPQQAFMRAGSNIFSRPELGEWIGILMKDKRYVNSARKGQFVRDHEGKMKFKTNEQLLRDGNEVHDYIFDFPLKDKTHVHGCYIEWSPPYRDPATGRIPDQLYRLWIDPYAQDKDQKEVTVKNSLGVVHVYETPNDFTPTRGGVIIGSFCGRPGDGSLDAFNEVAFNIAEYHNAVDRQIQFENDVGDIKGFARRTKRWHWLADAPSYEFAKELQGSESRDKGISMNQGQSSTKKNSALLYARDWLFEIIGQFPDGRPRMRLHYTYDLGILSEFQKYHSKGNFDRLSAILVGMLDSKEMLTRQVYARKNTQSNNPNSFFNRTLFKNKK
jgi:hypothetical protein